MSFGCDCRIVGSKIKKEKKRSGIHRSMIKYGPL
jgi:hypothetical protein